MKLQVIGHAINRSVLTTKTPIYAVKPDNIKRVPMMAKDTVLVAARFLGWLIWLRYSERDLTFIKN